MKIDRLIGILSLLLQRESVTAPDLAEKFEVSRRTILRDIDNLCKAGIPIVTRQGAGGGISIMDGYKVDRTLLTNREMQDILAGLRSLDSVNGASQYCQLMEKLSAGSSNFMTGNQSVLIDLSSWYKDSLTPKIEKIRTAVDTSRELEFCYYSPRGETVRRMEPYYLIFRWSSWYIWGWCKTREDFRLFKLNRMDRLRVLDSAFVTRPAPLPDLSNEQIFPGGIRVKALFSPDCKWRLVEEFGPKCFTVQKDGRLLFHADYTGQDNLLCWLLTYGDKAVLLEPPELREKILKLRRECKRITHRRLQMEYIKITQDNLEREHICCAISSNKDPQVQSKKAWLRDRLGEGLVFLRGDVRGKCFIEYIPAENAWVPLRADGYMHINCFWVSGACKGHGSANDLLERCISDAQAKGKLGLTVIASEKKKPFLSDPGYLRHKGFRMADASEPYFALYYLPFSSDAPVPKFRSCVQLPKGEGFVLYYSSGCPFTAKYVPLLEAHAKENGIPFRSVLIGTREEAQNAPAVWTNYALFFNGAFVTHEILSVKKFQAICQELV